MKLVAAIVLVLSQVCLHSCRSRQTASLVRDDSSSELTLVSPHKVPSIAQLIPILEGQDPPEAKISKLKKLIPIYDELNRWRLNNKNRLVEIIPYNEKAKPLAFILPGSSYMNKFKKPNGSDKAPTEHRSSSKPSEDAIDKHAKQFLQHTDQPTYDTNDSHLLKNKPETHSENHLQKPKPHKSHTPNTHLHTPKTDTIGRHADPENQNNAETNNSNSKNKHHTKYDLDSPEVNRNNDLASNELNSHSHESEPDSETNESDFGSNEQNFESNDSGSSVHDSEPNNFKTALKSIKKYSDSNIQDSESSEFESNSNEHDSESHESDSASSVQYLESSENSGYSSSKSNELDSISNDKSSDIDPETKAQEPELYSKLSAPVLESILSYINLDISKSDLESNLTSNSSKSGSDEPSNSHDHSVFNEVNLLPEYDSKTLELHDSVSASDEILSDEFHSESESNSESESKPYESNSESRQSNSLTPVESLEKVAPIHAVRIYPKHDSIEPHESTVDTGRLSGQNENEDDELITSTMLSQEPNEIDGDESNNDESDEAYDPIATWPLVNRFHNNFDDEEEFIVDNTKLVDKHHKNYDPDDESYEIVAPSPGTKKHHVHDHHDIHDEHNDYDDLITAGHLAKKHLGNDVNAPDDALVTSSRKVKHHDNDVDDYEDNDSAIGDQLIANRHEIDDVNSDLTDEPEDETTPGLKHHDYELNSDRPNADSENVFYGDADSNDIGDLAPRHHDFLAIPHNYHETDDDWSNNGEPNLLNEVSESDDGSNDDNKLDDDPKHKYETMVATRRMDRSNDSPYECKPNNADESKEDHDLKKSKKSGKLLAARRRITEDVELNRKTNESPELCEELSTDHMPALRKPGPKFRRQKNYIFSFIFNR